MTGVAVCAAVERVCGVRPGLKWPNDPVMGGRKLCGILTELSLEAETGRLQYLVVGVGVNVLHSREDFAPELAEVATSLAQELGHPVSRPELAAALIEELDRLYQALENDGAVSECLPGILCEFGENGTAAGTRPAGNGAGRGY